MLKNKQTDNLFELYQIYHKEWSNTQPELFQKLGDETG